jgi:hypothetical protein
MLEQMQESRTAEPPTQATRDKIDNVLNEFESRPKYEAE